MLTFASEDDDPVSPKAASVSPYFWFLGAWTLEVCTYCIGRIC